MPPSLVVLKVYDHIITLTPKRHLIDTLSLHRYNNPMFASLPRKTIATLLLALGLIALTILAAGLSEVNLQPGRSFIITEEEEERSPALAVVGASQNWLLAIAIGLAFIATMINIFRKDQRGWQHRLPGLIAFLLFILLFLFLRDQADSAVMMNNTDQESLPQQSIDLGEFIEEAQPIEPGNFAPSDLLVAAVGVGTGLLLAGLGYFVYRRWFGKPAAATLQQLALDAEATLLKLQVEDGNLRDVVMRSYYDMSKTVSEQGVQRAEGMTPREFEERLIQAGLPRRDVERLTRLFEEVRYGHVQVGERQKREAIACMEAIVAAAKRRATAVNGQPAQLSGTARLS